MKRVPLSRLFSLAARQLLRDARAGELRVLFFALLVAVAATSCGTEALILGSLITLASGVLTSSPSSARSSGWRCASVSRSGKAAMIRPASEMSRVPTVTPAAEAKARMIGKSEAEAICGASSTLV